MWGRFQMPHTVAHTSGNCHIPFILTLFIHMITDTLQEEMVKLHKLKHTVVPWITPNGTLGKISREGYKKNMFFTIHMGIYPTALLNTQQLTKTGMLRLIIIIIIIIIQVYELHTYSIILTF
jgi:hypothetical protein